MHRILALDIGEKRIGVAVSDALNITAQGLDVIARKNTDDTLRRIRVIVKEYDVSKIIVGLPLNMNGTKGPSAKLTEAFADLLRKEIPVQIEMVDERLTTAQGERFLLEADVSRRKRKLVIDRIASQLILQTYMDSYVQKDKTE